MIFCAQKCRVTGKFFSNTDCDGCQKVAKMNFVYPCMVNSFFDKNVFLADELERGDIDAI